LYPLSASSAATALTRPLRSCTFCFFSCECGECAEQKERCVVSSTHKRRAAQHTQHASATQPPPQSRVPAHTHRQCGRKRCCCVTSCAPRAAAPPPPHPLIIIHLQAELADAAPVALGDAPQHVPLGALHVGLEQADLCFLWLCFFGVFFGVCVCHPHAARPLSPSPSISLSAGRRSPKQPEPPPHT
jgi:hypothetical protein